MRAALDAAARAAGLGPAPAGRRAGPGRDAGHAQPRRGDRAAPRWTRRGRWPPARPPRAALHARSGSAVAVVRDARRRAARCSSPATGPRSRSRRRRVARRPVRRGRLLRRHRRRAARARRAAVGGGAGRGRGRVGVRRRGRRRRASRPSAGRPRRRRRRRSTSPRACAARGGTVVATGGCFDLLHAGHVRMLEQARALGDCLVVCLNSDASRAPAQGRRPPARRAGRPRRGAARPRAASTPSRSSTRTTRARVARDPAPARVGQGRRLRRRRAARGRDARRVGRPRGARPLRRGPLDHPADHRRFSTRAR